MLFSGDVVWFERGREENQTDTFLRIYANSFDIAINQSMVNTTLPAGSTQKDVAQACVDAMNKDESTLHMALGTLTAGMEDAKSPRSRTLYGMPKDILRDVAQTVGGHCFIDPKGKVNIVKPDDPPSASPVVVLNSRTGMIGVPHQNIDGSMSARCLLNPSIPARSNGTAFWYA